MENDIKTGLSLRINNISLKADLVIPGGSTGLVIFSHGSGSSRLSKRNVFVASRLQEQKLATLLFDLLTEEEDMIYETRFDIDLLTQRLVAVTRELNKNPQTRDLKKGFFGASTGAASALRAAAELGEEIQAVVSRGGRPDMAGNTLDKVLAPTLLIVGGDDEVVIQLNKQAYALLNCEKKLEIVPGASHLFEEPGTLEEVARLSANWFANHL